MAQFYNSYINISCFHEKTLLISVIPGSFGASSYYRHPALEELSFTDLRAMQFVEIHSHHIETSYCILLGCCITG